MVGPFSPSERAFFVEFDCHGEGLGLPWLREDGAVGIDWDFGEFGS